MLTRYGITASRAFGVPISAIQQIAKRLGGDHDLAAALWSTGWYEARLLAAYVDDAARVTAAQMDRWARDFDNWGVCDTLCFVLFDRAPGAWRKVELWSKRREEFVRRAAFALLASLALHDRKASDESFLRCLAFAERAATDERPFVQKGVSWALRAIGQRNHALNAAVLDLARRLAAAPDAPSRWTGKDVLRDLKRPAARKRLAASRRASRS